MTVLLQTLMIIDVKPKLIGAVVKSDAEAREKDRKNPSIVPANDEPIKPLTAEETESFLKSVWLTPKRGIYSSHFLDFLVLIYISCALHSRGSQSITETPGY